jgi:subtilisin family serine protease
MTGRRFFLIITLSAVLSAPLHAASYPLIVQISPASDITSIAAALGGVMVDSIPGADTYLLDVPLIPAATTASVLGIQWMELNTGVTLPGFAVLGIVTVPATTAADWYKYQPSWQLIHAQNALSYSTGRGVVVADINSQVDYAHPALGGHLTSGYDFVTNKPVGSAALNQSEAGFLDDSEAGFLDGTGLLVNPAYSHGTLCAGVIAVIAPDSMIMPLRAFDDQGKSDVFMIAKAIRYAVQHGAQVINMSFGTLSYSQALRSAIAFAQASQVLLSASAGNNDTSAPQYPAGFSGVMTTAATTLFDTKASFSKYGSYVFIDATGVNMICAYPGGYYSVVSGTSFSAPVVAGVAALVGSLRATGVRDSIAGGAVNIDSNNPNYANQLGYGRIDVLHAVKPN